MEFLRSLPRCNFAGKPVVASRNVGRFLRLEKSQILLLYCPIQSVIMLVIKQIRLLLCCCPILLTTCMISNGNKTEWSPIWSAIIRVINKIRGHPIWLITSMITDRIGLHSVLLTLLTSFFFSKNYWAFYLESSEY